MSELRNALEEYLAIRREVGFRLEVQGNLLRGFVDFAGTEGASCITRDLALHWATQPKGCHPAQWAKRLGLVRRFAEYRSAVDPRTEIPSAGLLPHRFRRKPPYVYSDSQIAADRGSQTSAFAIRYARRHILDGVRTTCSHRYTRWGSDRS